jgi:RNA-directed DNA polymerase
MDQQSHPNPAAPVPATDRQAAEIRARWAWAEGTVWTDRMLTALENGVKGGCWFSLIDKVHLPRNLLSAWQKVAANQGAAGVDQVTVAQYARHLEANLKNLEQQLRQGTYRPQAIRRVYIPKPGSHGELRPLGIPTVRDRVAQGALRHVLEPIFEKQFAQHSYGFRPGRGCKDALRRVDGLLKEGYGYVVDADLKGYFDSIPHGKLLERVREQVSDGPVLKLIEAFLKAGVMEGLEQWTPASGAPQGAVLSPLLSNVYLNPLDHRVQQGGWQMVRYADDFVILCRSRAEAEAALACVQQWTAQAGLQLHPDKTRIVAYQHDEGLEFLGYRFEQGRKRPRDKSLRKLKETIRGQTRRTNGQSLGHIIHRQVNPTLRGWFAYFKHSPRSVFGGLDGWIRMRLRSILRKRQGQRGRGRGSDHQRWPNAYFAAQGLYSLKAAHVAACQSA